MPVSCCVINCANRGYNRETKLSFYRFPKNVEKKALWVAAVKRKDWEPNDNHRVCSRHFITGKKSDDPLNPDYVPSVHMGYDTGDKLNMPSYRNARYRKREQNAIEKENDTVAATILLELSSRPLETTNSEPTQSTDIHGPCIATIAQLRLEKQQMMQELERLQCERDSLKTMLNEVTFGPHIMKDNDSRTASYTGLPSYAVFMWLLSFVSHVLPQKKCLDSGSILMMVLMKLRLNLFNFDLAVRFRVSESVVSDIINKVLPEIASKLKFLIHWPEKAELIRTTPAIVKKYFRGCVGIIDCTEIFIDRPGNLTARAATWSNYKHNNTLKLLVAINPCGSITFLSRVFGGRTSDKVITQRSGFLDLIRHGDVVLADRGFLISDEINSRGAILVMPAFIRNQNQLSQKDVEKTRNIANIRIHVERAIGRLKIFKVINDVMPMNLVPHVDAVLTICAAICNLHENLLE